jgi:hypothetical protein
MLRLSRARVIGDIEFLINSPGAALGQRKWTAKGTECSIDRHHIPGSCTDCPSSDDLRHFVGLREGGSGSLGVEVMRRAGGGASDDLRLSGV